MSLKAELTQIFYDLQILKQPGRDEIAHFCQHRGIRIWFTRTRTTWRSIGQSAIRPWWMILEPLRTQPDAAESPADNNNNKAVEVTENA